jgi:RimJ/RimL family protein N-acetyltransferase
MMSKLVLRTEHLELVIQTTEDVLAWIEALSPAERAEVSPEWIARVRGLQGAEPDPWMHGFAIVDRASSRTIGSCGYKGPPDPNGTVEIAYGVDAEHRGRGHATEAAEALVQFAFGDERVRVVRAHTRGDNAASARVLAKCAFKRLREVVDPEDGLVWRWERSRTRLEPSIA